MAPWLLIALPLLASLAAFALLSAKHVTLSAEPGLTRLVLASLALLGLGFPLAPVGAIVLHKRLGWLSGALALWLVGIALLTGLMLLNAAPRPL